MNERLVSERIRSAEIVRLSGRGTSALPPRDGAVGVSLGGLRGITDFRPEDLVVSALAGTTLREIDAALRELGRRLPLRPFDEGQGTIGGAVAAAADGLAAREGFRWRDVVLGLRAVPGDGDAVRVGAAVVKSVAGWDVARALVGSRGTLAAITEVTFRVEPIPETTVAWTRCCDADARAAVAAADGLPFAPRGLVVSSSEQGISVDALLEGPAAAVETAGRRLACAGFERTDDAEGRWAALTRRASAPAPAGSTRHARVASRVNPLDGVPPGAVADVLRQRVTWIAVGDGRVGDDGAAEAATTRLFDRLRGAFRAERFQPGRGFGAP